MKDDLLEREQKGVEEEKIKVAVDKAEACGVAEATAERELSSIMALADTDVTKQAQMDAARIKVRHAADILYIIMVNMICYMVY